MRGGISFIGHPYSKANHHYISDKENELNRNDNHNDFIFFCDLNNQYGWAMSQYLPEKNFEWDNEFTKIKDMNVLTEKILDLNDESLKGYIFEVDLKYPDNLHNLHDELPLCPEQLMINDEWLSSDQLEMKKNLQLRGKSKKLCLTLFDKTKYVIHYRNLKFCLQQGLVLRKVHNVLKFDQSPWLKPYIMLNTQLRQSASSKFEENFAKLMNNSVYGK